MNNLELLGSSDVLSRFGEIEIEIDKIHISKETSQNKFIDLTKSFYEFVGSLDDCFITSEVLRKIEVLRNRLIFIEKVRDFQFFSLPFFSRLSCKFSDLPGTEMLDYTNRMPSTFWLNLAKANSEQSRDCRVCLILLARDDWNGVFTSAAAQHFIIQVSKLGYAVALKIINDKRSILPHSRETANFFGKKINALILSAHGIGESGSKRGVLLFNQNTLSKNYFLEDVNKDDFSYIDPKDGQVILKSCFGSPFAQKISSVAEISSIGVKNEEVEFSIFVGRCRNCNGLALQSLEPDNVIIEYFDKMGSKKSNCTIEENGLIEDRIHYLENSIPNPDISDLNDAAGLFLYSPDSLKLIFNIEEMANKYLFMAAKLGCKISQYDLGRIYESAAPGALDSRLLARKWYQISAENGLIPAQMKLGSAYENGELGIRENLKLAISYYKMAASQGNINAKTRLGVIYSSGKVRQPPIEEITPFLEAAAADGYPKAQYELGVFYELGRAGERDLIKSHRKALQLYYDAADAGYSIAEYKLGVIYEKGLYGVFQSVARAIAFYQLAADHGDARAKRKLSQLTASRPLS